MTDKLYIVVPCYNEQEVLGETSKRLKVKMNNLMERNLIDSNSKVVFVNDGSKDTTCDIIKS